MIIRTLLSIYFLMHITAICTDTEFNIIFPSTYPLHSQGIKIYHGGMIIPIENYGNKICFFIKNNTSEKRMFLLVVNPINLEYHFNKSSSSLFQNTVQNRTIATEKDYKLYVISNRNGTWQINQDELNENRIIPDNALILCYDPSYISHLDVQNSIDIYIKNNIAEERLRNEEIIYLLNTLHTDPLYHQPTKYTVNYKLCKQVVVGG
jgi:hypothetical protein